MNSNRLSAGGSTVTLIWQCYDEIYDQQQDRRKKNWRQFVKSSQVNFYLNSHRNYKSIQISALKEKKIKIK